MEGIANINTSESRVNLAHIQNGSSYPKAGRLKYTAVEDRVSLSSAKQTNPIERAVDDFLAEKAPKLFMKKYLNPHVLRNAYMTNPQIQTILDSKGLSNEFHMENITGENQNHFITTYQKANELGKNLPDKDRKALMQAALLHDIGKAYIPVEILNKNGKLTEEERDIINIHAQLGEEILKTTGLSPKVANLAGLHHSPCNNPLKGMSANILSAADVYSALNEERPYKPKFNSSKVSAIMQDDPKLDSEIVAKCF